MAAGTSLDARALPITHRAKLAESGPVVLGSEGRPAATASRGIGILERETRTHNTGYIVDFHAIKILRTEHIYEKPHAFLIENVIALSRLFFDIQTVLESGAAAGHNANAQPGSFGQPFL